jgi:hypothetical protein
VTSARWISVHWLQDVPAGADPTVKADYFADRFAVTLTVVTRESG